MNNFINEYYASNNIYNRDSQYKGGRASDIEIQIKMYSDNLLKKIYGLEKDCDIVFDCPEKAEEILYKYGFKITDNFELVMKSYHTWLRNKYENILFNVKNIYEEKYEMSKSQIPILIPNEFDTYGGSM